MPGEMLGDELEPANWDLRNVAGIWPCELSSGRGQQVAGNEAQRPPSWSCSCTQQGQAFGRDSHSNDFGRGNAAPFPSWILAPATLVGTLCQEHSGEPCPSQISHLAKTF